MERFATATVDPFKHALKHHLFSIDNLTSLTQFVYPMQFPVIDFIFSFILKCLFVSINMYD